MELKYCDRCGTIISDFVEAFGEDTGRTSPYLCKSCRGPESTNDPAEENPLRLFDTPPPTAPDPEAQSLELFSENSFRVRKQEVEKKPKTRAPKKVAKEPQAFELPPNESLTLFSEDSVVMKKQKHFGSTSTRGSRAAQGSAAVKAAAAKTQAKVDFSSGGSGSAVPAKSATRVQYHCLHCGSKLLVKPVKKLSRLACPRCSKQMYIDSNGQISQEIPKSAGSGSLRGRQTQVAGIDSGTESVSQPVRPGSARQKVDSSAVRTSSASVPKAPKRLPSPEHSSGQANADHAPAGVTQEKASHKPSHRAPVRRPQTQVPDEKEFVEELLTDLSANSAVPWSKADHASSLAGGTTVIGDWASEPRSFLQALIFGLILIAPLLVSSALMAPTGAETSPTDTSSKGALEKNLESAGHAVRRAYRRVYAHFSP